MTTDTSSALPERDLALSADLAADGGEDATTGGTGLCLSGGGYRAMVFHVGVLWRLNEAGLLPQLDRVSSVSGGSVTAGVLAGTPMRRRPPPPAAGPGFLSPCTVDLEHEDWVTDPGNDLTDKDFREQISLSDGGVYDNLGLQSTWNSCQRILVSDAGGHIGADPSPPTDWLRYLLRVLSVIDNQVRSLRKQQVIKAFRAGTRSGVYVGIRSDQADYPRAAQIPAHPSVTKKLADVPTRLDALKPDLQEQLINWGYAISDTGLPAHVDRDLPPGRLPYPKNPLT